jgi:hypothetical protein
MILLVSAIDFSNQPAIFFSVTLWASFFICYVIVRYFMVKYTGSNGPTILIFIFYMFYVIFLNNGVLAPGINLGTNPVTALLGIIFIVGLFYFVTGIFEGQSTTPPAQQSSQQQPAHHQVQQPVQQPVPQPSTAALFQLKFSNRTIPLNLGDTLCNGDIPGLNPQAGGNVVAEVNSNPQNPAMMGLKNLSANKWTVVVPGSSPREVPPGKSVLLKPGVKIMFGPTSAEVT